MVTGNTITATGSARGIHAEGPLLQTNVIAHNTPALDSVDGMLIVTPATGGSGSVIADNTLSGSGAHGIFIDARGAPKAGGVVLSNNTITGFKTALSIR